MPPKVTGAAQRALREWLLEASRSTRIRSWLSKAGRRPLNADQDSLEMQWAREMPGELPFGLTRDDDGNVYLPISADTDNAVSLKDTGLTRDLQGEVQEATRDLSIQESRRRYLEEQEAKADPFAEVYEPADKTSSAEVQDLLDEQARMAGGIEGETTSESFSTIRRRSAAEKLASQKKEKRGSAFNPPEETKTSRKARERADRLVAEGQRGQVADSFDEDVFLDFERGRTRSEIVHRSDLGDAKPGEVVRLVDSKDPSRTREEEIVGIVTLGKSRYATGPGEAQHKAGWKAKHDLKEREPRRFGKHEGADADFPDERRTWGEIEAETGYPSDVLLELAQTDPDNWFVVRFKPRTLKPSEDAILPRGLPPESKPLTGGPGQRAVEVVQRTPAIETEAGSFRQGDYQVVDAIPEIKPGKPTERALVQHAERTRPDRDIRKAGETGIIGQPGAVAGFSTEPTGKAKKAISQGTHDPIDARTEAPRHISSPVDQGQGSLMGRLVRIKNRLYRVVHVQPGRGSESTEDYTKRGPDRNNIYATNDRIFRKDRPRAEAQGVVLESVSGQQGSQPANAQEANALAIVNRVMGRQQQAGTRFTINRALYPRQDGIARLLKAGWTVLPPSRTKELPGNPGAAVVAFKADGKGGGSVIITQPFATEPILKVGDQAIPLPGGDSWTFNGKFDKLTNLNPQQFAALMNGVAEDANRVSIVTTGFRGAGRAARKMAQRMGLKVRSFVLGGRGKLDPETGQYAKSDAEELGIDSRNPGDDEIVYLKKGAKKTAGHQESRARLLQNSDGVIVLTTLTRNGRPWYDKSRAPYRGSEGHWLWRDANAWGKPALLVDLTNPETANPERIAQWMTANRIFSVGIGGAHGDEIRAYMPEQLGLGDKGLDEKAQIEALEAYIRTFTDRIGEGVKLAEKTRGGYKGLLAPTDVGQGKKAMAEAKSRVITMDHVTRQIVKQHPESVFLFGDNLQGKGLGGQAKEMRGEPNAIGIPTKKSPSMDEGAFFTDAEYEQNVQAIDQAFARIPPGVQVVVPKAGLGTGLAQLEKRAPMTFAYLVRRLNRLDASDGATDMVTLYRVESPKGPGVADWVKQGLKESGAEDAAGRWFTDDPKTLEFYKQDAGPGYRVVTIQVPRSQVEQFRVRNQPAAIKRFSRDHDTEFFVPRELASQATPLTQSTQPASTQSSQPYGPNLQGRAQIGAVAPVLQGRAGARTLIEGDQGAPTVYPLVRVISDGQDGIAFEGMGLAKDAGFETQSLETGNFVDRIRQSVVGSDGTVVFFQGRSPQSQAAIKIANQNTKPLLINPKTPDEIIRFVREHEIKTLNIAGARFDEVHPGFYQDAKDILGAALRGETARREGAGDLAPGKVLIVQEGPTRQKLVTMLGDQQKVLAVREVVLNEKGDLAQASPWRYDATESGTPTRGRMLTEPPGGTSEGLPVDQYHLMGPDKRIEAEEAVRAFQERLALALDPEIVEGRTSVPELALRAVRTGRTDPEHIGPELTSRVTELSEQPQVVRGADGEVRAKGVVRPMGLQEWGRVGQGRPLHDLPPSRMAGPETRNPALEGRPGNPPETELERLTELTGITSEDVLRKGGQSRLPELEGLLARAREALARHTQIAGDPRRGYQIYLTTPWPTRLRELFLRSDPKLLLASGILSGAALMELLSLAGESEEGGTLEAGFTPRIKPGMITRALEPLLMRLRNPKIERVVKPRSTTPIPDASEGPLRQMQEMQNAPQIEESMLSVPGRVSRAFLNTHEIVKPIARSADEYAQENLGRGLKSEENPADNIQRFWGGALSPLEVWKRDAFGDDFTYVYKRGLEGHLQGLLDTYLVDRSIDTIDRSAIELARNAAISKSRGLPSGELQAQSDRLAQMDPSVKAPMGMTKEQAAQAREKILASVSPEERELLRRIVEIEVPEFGRMVLQAVEDEGIIQKGTVERLIATGDIYAPLHWIQTQGWDEVNGILSVSRKSKLEALESAKRAGRTLSLGDERLLQRLQGGVGGVPRDPLEALFTYAEDGAREIARNKGAKELANQLLINPRSDLNLDGNGVIRNPSGFLADITGREDILVPSGYGTINFFEDGVKRTIIGKQEIVDAVRYADVASIKAGIWALQQASKLIHVMATGTNLAFFVRNMVKDPMDTYLNFPNMRVRDFAGRGADWDNPGKKISYIREWAKIFGYTLRQVKGREMPETLRRFKMDYADNAGLTKQINPEIEAWDKAPSDPIRKALYWSQRLLNASETANKAIPYKLARDKGESGAQAAIWSRKYAGTPDLARRGEKAQLVGEWIMYFNPAVQGVQRTIERYRNDPVALLQHMTGIGIAAAAVDQLNRDEDNINPETGRPEIENIPEDQRNSSLIFLIPETWHRNSQGHLRLQYVRIPLSHTAQMFYVPILSAIRFARNEPGITTGEAVMDTVATAWPGNFKYDSNSSVGDVATSMVASLNPLPKAIYEIVADKNTLTGTPIAGRRQLREAGFEQSNPTSSPFLRELYKKLGSKTPGSPLIVEHLIRSILPGYGEMGLSVADALTTGSLTGDPNRVMSPAERRAFIPGLGQITRGFSSTPSSQIREDYAEPLFSKADEYNKGMETIRKYEKSTDPTAKADLERTLRSDYGRIPSEQVSTPSKSGKRATVAQHFVNEIARIAREKRNIQASNLPYYEKERQLALLAQEEFKLLREVQPILK